MRRNRGIIYAPKVCEVCEYEYVPTSGRQLVCESTACRNELERRRVVRKLEVRRERVGRPLEKQCEWAECTEIFALSPTGVRPKYCVSHRKEIVAPKAQAATKKWRLQTIDVACRYQDCANLQHPAGRGWCYFHYPILSMHGLDADGWWVFYENQDGVCPVCSMPLFDGRTIAVDHDHSTAPSSRHDVEHVRGLLHAVPCNSAVLGGIETAIRNGWFLNALLYIKYPLPESNRHSTAAGHQDCSEQPL